jgi:hypothetical protein
MRSGDSLFLGLSFQLAQLLFEMGTLLRKEADEIPRNCQLHWSH